MSKKNDNVQITVAKGILVPAFVMLLVAALTFVTASYAWFSTTVPYNVDDIGMSAGANNNAISVSADCENWASDVGKAELLAGYEGSRNVLPNGEIAPVSSAGIFDGDSLLFFKGRAVADGVIASQVSEPDRQSLTGDFFAYDLFFRAETAGTLYLGEESAVYDVQRSATPVSASARVAFVNYGYADDPAAARALSKPIVSRFLAGYKAVASDAPLEPLEIYYYNNGESYVRIKDYELDWDLFDKLQKEGNLYVKDDSVLHETPLRIWEPNAATHTASVTATGPIETRAVTAEGYITEENTALVNGEALFNDLHGFSKDTTYVATVEPGYNKVRIYMWIEGQDADAIDEVSGRSFSAQLRFVLA